MSMLTDIRKKVLGAGAEQYLPFALSRLRQMAESSPDAYQSRVWHTADGVTILAEFWPPSAGAVTLIGTGFLSVGTLVQKGPYVLTGSSSLKKDFKEFATDIGTEPKNNCDMPKICPINRNESLIHRLDGTHFTIYKVTGNGTATPLLQIEYGSPPTGSASAGTVCYVGKTGDTGADRLLAARAIYANDYYRMQMGCSDDRGKTWTWYWPIGTSYQNDKHQYWGDIAYLGNGIVLCISTFLTATPSSYIPTEPVMLRSSDYGNTWSVCSLTGLFDWAVAASGERDLDWVLSAVNNSAVVPMGGGKAMLFMYVYNSDTPGREYKVYVSNDNGLTWGAGKPLAGYISTPIPLGPGGVAVVVAPAAGESASYDWALAITGDYGASWTYRSLPTANPDFPILPDPTLLAHPPLVTNGSTVDIDKARIAVPFYVTDGYYAWYTTDGGILWEMGGRIAETALRPEGLDDLDYQLDYERIAALSVSGSIAFPTLYTNTGEPLS